MNPSFHYFNQISIFGTFAFGTSATLLKIILSLSIAFTGIHVWQEARAMPLYRVFGAIAGFWFPGWIGFGFFTLGLPILLWWASLVAYAGCLPYLGTPCVPCGVFALGFLLGARLGDSVISHWRLSWLGYNPNPGLSSTVLYAMEAILIIVAFEPGFALARAKASEGAVLGILFFLVPIPLMKLSRRFIKSSKRPCWIPRQEFPDWAGAWK